MASNNDLNKLLQALLPNPDILKSVVSALKNAESELKNIDTYLTEISKANESLSKSDLAQIFDSSFETAGKYGKSAADYLSGVLEATRAGYENAAGIAELSIAAQGAGNMTAELANQYIRAVDNAYEMNGSVEKLTAVLDGSNYIADHNAVTMGELAEGMSTAGRQTASLGLEANEATAALGTLISATGYGASEIADAWKAILLYLNQITDTEEGISADELAKYETACKALNVSLKETKNGVSALRDPMEILEDLADAYADLDPGDTRRTDLLDSVGGSLRADALDAFLENYDTYTKMLDEYESGAGSLAAEAEKTANSWEGAFNRLYNTWVDTVENAADSDAIISIINGLNNILTTVNHVTETVGSFGTIGLGAGLFAGLKNVGKPERSGFLLF